MNSSTGWARILKCPKDFRASAMECPTVNEQEKQENRVGQGMRNGRRRCQKQRRHDRHRRPDRHPQGW
ncbi:hypothetical protein ACW4TU_01390 [Streptomyces sp. QTS52]